MPAQTNNYILKTKVFILGSFSANETNSMIGDLSNLIYELPVHPIYNENYEIKSPYDTENIPNPIIDIYINSNGGDVSILHSISALLSIARSRGAIIRTTVLNKAYSCGSLLAIQGTPGFRLMHEEASHLIHFGRKQTVVEKEDEIKLAAEYMRQSHKSIEDIYLRNTNLDKQKLKQTMKNEYGFLYAQECLQHNICDWIIDSFGNIRGKIR